MPKPDSYLHFLNRARRSKQPLSSPLSIPAFSFPAPVSSALSHALRSTSLLPTFVAQRLRCWLPPSHAFYATMCPSHCLHPPLVAGGYGAGFLPRGSVSMTLGNPASIVAPPVPASLPPPLSANSASSVSHPSWSHLAHPCSPQPHSLLLFSPSPMPPSLHPGTLPLCHLSTLPPFLVPAHAFTHPGSSMREPPCPPPSRGTSSSSHCRIRLPFHQVVESRRPDTAVDSPTLPLCSVLGAAAPSLDGSADRGHAPEQRTLPGGVSGREVPQWILPGASRTRCGILRENHQCRMMPCG